MDNIWFTSDLHLGHKGIIKYRGFRSIENHDDHIIESINKVVRKRDKLFILGDVVLNNRSLRLLNDINGVKELIIGNHDRLSTREYLKYFTKVHGFRQYKGFWLSHCPIHPQEIHRCRGNIHGHIHNGAATNDIGFPYLNVNVDMNNYTPVGFSQIEEYYDTRGS